MKRLVVVLGATIAVAVLAGTLRGGPRGSRAAVAQSLNPTAAEAAAVPQPSGTDAVRVVERVIHPVVVSAGVPPQVRQVTKRPVAPHAPQRRSALARLFFGSGDVQPRPFPRPSDAQRATER